tara:strand:+ start:1306 stop:2040 length:735 start_codon:yes stop_codon:yes gene_type:complete
MYYFVDLTMFPALNRAIIIYLIIIFVITIYYLIYYSSIRIDFSLFSKRNPLNLGTLEGWKAFSASLAITLILATSVASYNGSYGDFGLDYCIDGDQITDGDSLGWVEIDENSFFACEIGYLDGNVELGYFFREFGSVGIGKVMILNHENYRYFTNGEIYGFSNFALGDLSLSSSDYPEGITGEYRIEYELTLHADSYFFVVVTEGGWDGKGMPASPKHETSSESINEDFAYYIDLDYREDAEVS